ncbi:MFS transporter [Natronolimnobius sp. AArcel1]|uniref:MFS transporter n=1 Tax=Natronolimnobius sp. AArcel1 TaxID=1679093 RepID=UPI0013EB40D7|nr:MFS transporter [Natronolimnobius sp. AArcel1]NGM70856.1 MFS transporter [Natronolimnobius sp. AArcel1]
MTDASSSPTGGFSLISPPIVITALLAATWFVLSVYRVTFSVALPDVLAETSVNYTEVSVLFGALFIGYAVSQFPAGSLADRVGVRTVLIGGAGIASLALSSLAVATNYFHVFAALLLVGTGIGSFRAVSQVAISSHVPDEYEGKALGLLTAAEPFSYVVGPVTVALLLETYDLYTMPLVLALAPLPLLGILLTTRSLPARVDSDLVAIPTFRQAGTVFRDLLRRTETGLLVGFGIAFSTTTNALIAILPWYLVETTSLTLTLGTLYAGGVFGAGAVGAILGGVLRDRVGAVPILCVGFAAAASMLVVFALSSTVGQLLVVLAVFSLGLNSILPARDRIINVQARECSTTHTGAMIGALRSLCYLGGGLGAVIVGLTFAQFGLTAGFGLLVILLCAGLCCSVALWYVSGRRY